jgi:hypothetical protein
MRTARIETFRTISPTKALVLLETTGEPLTPYEFDHLGDIVGAYLVAIGFAGVIGPTLIRTEMTDEHLEGEYDDFTVVRRAAEEK